MHIIPFLTTGKIWLHQSGGQLCVGMVMTQTSGCRKQVSRSRKHQCDIRDTKKICIFLKIGFSKALRMMIQPDILCNHWEFYCWLHWGKTNLDFENTTYFGILAVHRRSLEVLDVPVSFCLFVS